MASYFFENESESRWFRLATHTPVEQLFVLKDWVLDRSTVCPLPQEGRLDILKSLLPAAEIDAAALYLSTLEELRESFILIPEHVDHCFSALSPSPKNRGLRELLIRYFSSPLKNDWVSAAWEVIGLLKSGSITVPGTGDRIGAACATTPASTETPSSRTPDSGDDGDDVVVINGFSPSLISKELVTALNYSQKNLRVLEMHQFDACEVPIRRRYGGPFHVRMITLARLAAEALKLGKTRILIPFAGTTAEKRTLQAVLASCKVSSLILESSPSNSMAPGPLASNPMVLGPMAQNVHRLDRYLLAPFPLLERLHLVRLALQGPSDILHQPYWSALLKKEKILQSHFDWVTGNCPESTGTPKTLSTPPQIRRSNAYIGPFVIPPERDDTCILPFLSDDPFVDFQGLSLLRDEEKNHLFRQGFPLPRRRDLRACILAQVEAASTIFCHPKLETTRPFEKGTPVQGTDAYTINRDSTDIHSKHLISSHPRHDPSISLPSKPWSATALETMATCPTQYFFSQRLRIRPHPTLSDDSLALHFGSAIHLTLERHLLSRSLVKSRIAASISSINALSAMTLQSVSLVKSGIQSALPGAPEGEPPGESVANPPREPPGKPEDDVNTEKNHAAGLESIFDDVLNETFPEYPRDHIHLRLMRGRFRRLVGNITTIENTLADLFKGAQPRDLEVSFTSTLAGVPVRGKIDRIDCLPDGSHLLLDYKTGTVDFTPNHIAKGTHFQALLYLLSAPRSPLIGFLFLDIKKGEIRRGLLKEECVTPEAKAHLTRGHVLKAEKFEATLSDGLTHLTRLADIAGKGVFAPNPVATHCGHCEFKGQCREAYGTHP